MGDTMRIFYALFSMIHFFLLFFSLIFCSSSLFSMELSELSGEVTDDSANRYFLTKEYDNSIKYSSPFDSDTAAVDFVKSKNFQRAVTRSIEFAKNKIAQDQENEEFVDSAVPVLGYEYGRVNIVKGQRKKSVSIVVEENKELRDYYRKNIPRAREFVAQYKTYLSKENISDKEIYKLFIANQLHDDVKKIEKERSKRGVFSRVVDTVRSAIKFKPHKEDLERQKIYKAWQQMDGEKRQSPFATGQVEQLTPLLSLVLKRNSIKEKSQKLLLERPFEIDYHGKIKVPQQHEGDCGHRAVYHAKEFLRPGVDYIKLDKNYNEGLSQQKNGFGANEWLYENDVQNLIERENLESHVGFVPNVFAYLKNGSGLMLKTLHQFRTVQRAWQNEKESKHIFVLGTMRQNGEIQAGGHDGAGHYFVVVVEKNDTGISYRIADSLDAGKREAAEKFITMLQKFNFENVADIPENFADNSEVNRYLTELEKIHFMQHKNYSRNDCKKKPQELIARILIAARKLTEITNGKSIWTEDGCSDIGNEIRKVFRALGKLNGQTIIHNGKKRGPKKHDISLKTEELDEMDEILNSLGDNNVEE